MYVCEYKPTVFAYSMCIYLCVFYVGSASSWLQWETP